MEITFSEYFELQISNQANEAVFRLEEHWRGNLITLILTLLAARTPLLPWYLSCGTLKIQKLNFSQQVWS